MIYVTSMPIKPSIVEYYLALLPGSILSHAMARLTLLRVGDSSPLPLSAKLLDCPRLLSTSAPSIPDCSTATSSRTTPPHSNAILRSPLASPCGADRAPQRQTGATSVPTVRGRGRTASPRCGGSAQLPGGDDGIMRSVEDRPSLEEVIVKRNEGVSGAGNALVDLRGIANRPPDSSLGGSATGPARCSRKPATMPIAEDEASSSKTAASSRSGSWEWSYSARAFSFGYVPTEAWSCCQLIISFSGGIS